MVALVAGFLTGCGGNGGAEPEVAPAPPAAITVDPDAVLEGEGKPSPAPDATAPEEAPADDPSAPAEDSDAASEAPPAEGAEPAPAPEATDCPALQSAWNATNQALVNLSADHPRALVNSFRVAAESMSGVEAVPDAISGPWSTMAGYLGRVNDAFQGIDPDDATVVAAAMAAAVSAADTQAATAAGQQITAFVGAGCTA